MLEFEAAELIIYMYFCIESFVYGGTHAVKLFSSRCLQNSLHPHIHHTHTYPHTHTLTGT